MIYAHITPEGVLIGMFDTEVGAGPPPELQPSLVEIDPAFRDYWINHPHLRLVDGELVQDDLTPPSAAQQLALLAPVSLVQMVGAMESMGLLTQAEGTAWVINGILPTAMSETIKRMPEELQFVAYLRAARPTAVLPNDPIVRAMADAVTQGAETDAFLVLLFSTASAL